MRHLQPGARILALSWDGETPAKLATFLAERGMGSSELTVLEAMGGPQRARALHDGRRLRSRRHRAAQHHRAAGRSRRRTRRCCRSTPGLDDALFEHDGQLTKREVRAVTLSALAPRQGELLWDVGLGAGSIAIEWLLRHPSLKAIGIEAEPERAARAARNAAALGHARSADRAEACARGVRRPAVARRGVPWRRAVQSRPVRSGMDGAEAGRTPGRQCRVASSRRRA